MLHVKSLWNLFIWNWSAFFVIYFFLEEVSHYIVLVKQEVPCYSLMKMVTFLFWKLMPDHSIKSTRCTICKIPCSCIKHDMYIRIRCCCGPWWEDFFCSTVEKESKYKIGVRKTTEQKTGLRKLNFFEQSKEENKKGAFKTSNWDGLN